MRAFLLLFIYFILSLGVVVNSQKTAIPNASVGSLYFTGTQTNNVIYGPFPNGSTSYWNIAQWNNPGPYEGDQVNYGQGPCSDPSTSWYVATGNMRVCVSEGSNQVELAQSSEGLPCAIEYEYDLFLGPNGGYAGENVNWSPMPTLGSLNYANFTFNLQLTYVNVEANCGVFPECGSVPDYAYVTAALTLNSVKGESLFYQIALFDTRAMSGKPWACPSSQSSCEAFSSWFFNSNPFGVDESIGSFGQPCLDDMQPHSYSLDVLSHLKALISNGPMQDNNWEDWTIGGGYIGLGGNGLFQTTLLVSGFQIYYG